MSGPACTLRRFFDEVYQPRRLIGCAAGTLQQYAVVLRHLDRHLCHTATLDDLSADTIAGFLAARAAEWSPSTTKKNRALLVAIWRLAAEKRLVAEFPDVQRIREMRRTPTAWTVDEVARILESAAAHPGLVGMLPAGVFWPGLIQVLYWTGLRITAALMIPYEACDLGAGRLFIAAESQKQRLDQMFRLPPVAVDALRAMWFPLRPLLFPWPYSRPPLYAHFREILARAGLPTTRRDMFQRLRRTTATLCQRYGADATAQLGHSSDAVTRRHYLAADCAIQAADVLPTPRINGAVQLGLFSG